MFPDGIDSLGLAGETGVDREEPSPPGPSNSISWVGPGGPNICDDNKAKTQSQGGN